MMNSRLQDEAKVIKEKPEKRDIYFARLAWDETEIEGIKVGYANDTEKRMKEFRTKAFAYASSCTLIESHMFEANTAKKFENRIKSEFRHFRDLRFPKNTETLTLDSQDRLKWAYKKVAQSPQRYREIFWRAANLRLNFKGKPRLKVYQGTGPQTGRYRSYTISDSIRERLPKINLHSELLDSGLAHTTLALETPYSIAIIYKIFIQATDQIPDFDDINTPEWRAGVYLGKKCATLFIYDREDYDDECIIEAGLTEPIGFFEVRFMEVTSKSSESRKIRVSRSCGNHLSRPLIDEILSAGFSERSRLDLS
jgi:hypothetical protein